MQRMFSSSANNIIHNPFALFPSSCAPPLQPIITNHDYNEIFLQHHHDLLPAAAASSLLPAANPQFTESLVNMALLNNATMCKQDGGGGVGLHGECNFGANPGFVIPVIKKPVKKDRHSKICTAQGVRDRRVRLSIEIAREFFDLQDMLGFDKASKTLEWLLRNSRNAIKELEMMKHGNGCQGSLSSSPECEMVAENIGDELDDRGDQLEGTSPKSKSAEGLVCKEKKMKKLQKATVHVLAKESRAKARARARERTREKMCNRSSSTHLLKRSSCPDTSPQFLNNVRSLAQLEASKKPANTYDQNMASSFKVVSGGAHQVDDPCPGGRRRQLSTSAARNNNVIEESIVIRRKLKPSTILGSQQINLAAAKDISCSSSSGNNNYFPNLPQNWDMNGAMAHSAFCAITNMNLSTGVQIYGKP